MKFFIDTANLDEIRECNELGLIDGVTNRAWWRGRRYRFQGI
jgi:hypothetical protein